MLAFTKQAYESFPIAADFALNMAEGETITAASVSAIDMETGEATPTVVGIAAPDGQTAVATVSGGERGKTYILTFQGQTSAPNQWELDIAMQVE